MLFRQIVDPYLAQYAYLIGCQKTKEALIIDPERDIDRYVEIAAQDGLMITHVAETHIHADFLSGSRQFAHDHDVKLYLSDEGGSDWSYEWARGIDREVAFLKDGDTFMVGNIEIKAVHTPGHTPEHLMFIVTDLGGGASEPIGIVAGDFLFVGDVGRPDLLETAAGQQASARPAAVDLYESITRTAGLPDYLQLWPGHGAGSACGKALGAVPQSTIGYERRFNAAIAAAQGGEEGFVEHILADQPEPPLYFARMKRDNKQGPTVLDGLPRPERLSVRSIADDVEAGALTLIDTRPAPSYMRGHLPGSILAPLDKSFPTVAGSYVMPEERIVLLVAEDEIEMAVRLLVRIGLDDVAGYVTPQDLAEYGAEHGPLRMLKSIDFDEVDGRRHYTNVLVLDVRKKDEWEQRHIPNAKHVPHVRLREYLDELPRDRTMLVHCQSGARSAVAAAYLHNRGFCVAYVRDHIDNWKERHQQEGVLVGTH